MDSKRLKSLLKTASIRFENWKPIHLCGLFKRLGVPIPRYLIGGGSDYTLSGSRIANATRTWQANEDVDVTGWTKANDFIFAAAVESGAHSSATGTLQLRWRDVSDSGSFAALASTGEINWTGATDLADGTAVATGEKGCTSGLTTYIEGIEREGANDVVKALGTNEWTEHQWAVDGSGADDGHKYEFEIYDVTEGAAVGTCLADITMATAASNYIRSVSDSVGITDVLSKIGTFIKTISDSAGITDSISTAAGKLATIADSVGITDTVSKIGTFIKTVIETEGITDMVSKAGTFIKTIADSLGITDLMTVIKSGGGVAKFASIFDTLGITDAIDKARGLARTISDSLGITDTASRVGAFFKSISDPVVVTDIFSKAGQFFRSITNSIGIADNVTAGVGGDIIDGPLCITISSAQGSIDITGATGGIEITEKSGSITITQERCNG